jgi:glycosyltransferase involved in cell wall biosynthesis
MKFRIFSAARSFGGGERYLSVLIPALRKRDHSVELVLPKSGAPRELRLLIEPIPDSNQPTIQVFNGIGSLYRQSWTISKRSAAIFVHHSSLTDDQSNRLKAALRPALLRFFGRKLSAIIRVCRSAMPDGAAPCPIYTVFNGVETRASERAERRPGDRFVIAMLGTLNANKNQAAAIRILASLPEMFVLKLIGDGPAAHELRDYASALGVAGRVTWTGFTSDPLSEMKTCHVALVLSKNEALPFSALEAMSLGVPVIAYRVGGLPELIIHDRNGIVVDAGQEDMVRLSLLRLGNDEAARRLLADSAVARIRSDFSVSAMTEGFEAVARSVMGQSP